MNIDWDGKGLPPVGTVCEHSGLIPGQPWTAVEIVAHTTFEGDDYPCAVFVYSQSSSHSSEGDHFRPLRTAGKERSEACDKMFGVLMNADLHRRGSCISDICEALYDAGYRKCP